MTPCVVVLFFPAVDYNVFLCLFVVRFFLWVFFLIFFFGGGVAVRCVRRVTIYYVCSLVLGEMAVFVLGSCSNNANQ